MTQRPWICWSTMLKTVAASSSSAENVARALFGARSFWATNGAYVAELRAKRSTSKRSLARSIRDCSYKYQLDRIKQRTPNALHQQRPCAKQDRTSVAHPPEPPAPVPRHRSG